MTSEIEIFNLYSLIWIILGIIIGFISAKLLQKSKNTIHKQSNINQNIEKSPDLSSPSSLQKYTGQNDKNEPTSSTTRQKIESNSKSETKSYKESAMKPNPPTLTSRKLSKKEFLQTIIKLGEIAQSCQELVDIESELSRKEENRLYLKRVEFKKLYSEIKATTNDSF